MDMRNAEAITRRNSGDSTVRTARRPPYKYHRVFEAVWLTSLVGTVALVIPINAHALTCPVTDHVIITTSEATSAECDITATGVLDITQGGHLTSNHKLNNSGALNIGPWDDENGASFLTNNSYINNVGSLNILDSSVLTNNLNVDNLGSLNLIGGQLINHGTFHNQLGGQVENNQMYSTITNYGNIINTGSMSFNVHYSVGDRQIRNRTGSTLLNEADGVISAGISSDGTVDNHGQIHGGLALVKDGYNRQGAMINTQYFYSSGLFINDGTIACHTCGISSGTFSGNGIVQGFMDLRSNGNINPGNTFANDPNNFIGDLTIEDGIYVQDSSPTLTFEITGSNYFDTIHTDKIYFSPGNQIRFDLKYNFRPHAGDTLDFLLANSITGFDNVSHSLHCPIPGLDYNVTVTPDQDLRLTFTETSTPPVQPTVQAGEVSVNQKWTTTQLTQSFTNPVVIAGIPSFNGGDPGVARLRNVGTGSFQARFQEWTYLDGNHGKEQIPYLVIDKGIHFMPDGSIWEVGTFSHKNTPNWTPHKFNACFAGTPNLYLTVQTYNGGQTVTPRVRNLTSDGFDAGLFEQESLMDGHIEETIGYLAIYSPASGYIDINGTTVPYEQAKTSVGNKWSPVFGHQIKVEEERSLDAEVAHKAETIDVIDLGGRLFGQDTTTFGNDTAALRQRP